MQWFIDIINKIIDAKCAANKVLIHSQLGYFDRGDHAVNDFTINDFNKNGAWHVLPLFPPVPKDAKLVLLSLNLNSALMGRIFDMRTHGNVNNFNLSRSSVQVTNVSYLADVIVAPDSNRIIEYRATVGGWITLTLNVRGWWLR